MFNLITILVGVLAVTLAAVVAEFTNAAMALPSAAVVFTVYASVHRDAFGALLTALVLGLVAGVSMGAARGVVLLSLLVVIVMTRWARGRLPLNRRLVLAAWVAAATIVADLTTVILGMLLLPGLPLAGALIRVSPLAALLSGLLAVPTFLILGWIEPFLRARHERSSLFV